MTESYQALAARAPAGPSALVLSNHWGVVDRRIVAQLNLLCRLGFEVTFVSVPATVPVDLDPRVRCVGLGSSEMARGQGPLLTLWSRFRRFVLNRWQTPAAYRLLEHLFLFRHLGRDVVREATPRLLPLVPDRPYALVECHDLATLDAGCAVKRRLHGACRLVYDAHELYPYQFHTEPLQRLWRTAELTLAPDVDGCITVNPSIASYMEKHFGYPSVQVVYNSVDTRPQEVRALSAAEFLAAFGAPPSVEQCVVFQGSTGGGRNVEALVASLRHLDPGVCLFFIGTGAESSLRRLASRCGVADRVFFRGWCEQEELLRIVAGADLGVIPYAGGDLLNNRLCTPNKLFEYIVCGVPIAASDLPELRRIVGGYGLGAVGDMGAPEGVAAVVRRALAAGGEAAFREGLARAQDDLGWPRQEEVLRRVFAPDGTASPPAGSSPAPSPG